MKNKTNKEYSNAYKNIVNDNTFSSLTESEPISLLDSIISGQLTRFESWKLISLIHEGELDCNLPQYGILTVHCLSKDIKQFDELFSQGCDLLRSEQQLTEKIEKEVFIKFKTKIKPKSKLFVKKSNKKPNKK